MADRVEVHHIFEMDHPRHGRFRDALIVERSEYDALTAKQKTDMKKARFDRWVAHLDNPPPPPTPEPEPDPLAALNDAEVALEVALTAVRQARG